jgi:hypothetical protein
MRSQVYFKTELRIERTMIVPRRNNPLKLVSGYGDAPSWPSWLTALRQPNRVNEVRVWVGSTSSTS